MTEGSGKEKGLRRGEQIIHTGAPKPGGQHAETVSAEGGRYQRTWERHTP